MDRFLPSGLRGKRIYWLLDLTYAGRVLRLSDTEIDVLTDDGDSLHYVGCLGDLDVTEAVDLLSSGSSTPASVTIDAVLPVDVPALVARGHDLSGARGTLCRWIEGITREQARTVLVGVVSDPEYGSADEPVSFSLEASAWNDSSLIPSSSQAVTSANWDDSAILSLSEEEFDLAYPIIIGRPGVVSTAVSSTGRVTGSQGVYVDHRKSPTSGSHYGNITVVVAGHHVSAESVYAVTSDYTTGTRFLVLNGHDRKGHPVAFIPWYESISTAGTDPFIYDSGATYVWSLSPIACLGHNLLDASFAPDDGDTPSGIFLSWADDDDPSAGGLTGADGSLVRGAGDVLEYLLGFTSMAVDRGRFAAAKPALNRFQLDFVIDAQVTPWEYLTANLLPILPVSIASGPSGLYPVVWRYDATEDDAVCHLDCGIDPSVERASNVSYDREIINDYSLKYALSLRIGSYQGLARLVANPDDVETDETIASGLISYHCRISQARYRRPDGSPLVVEEVLESPCIYDDSTANAVLAWRSRAFALARRRVTYAAPETSYGHLERGQIITITDAGVAFDRVVALVESIRTDGSGLLRLALLLIEDPARDARI